MTMTDAWSPTVVKNADADTANTHELDNLEAAFIPNEEPPHPKAVEWIRTANEAKDKHGELTVKDDAQYERIRGYLRRAAESLDLSATCKAIKDKNDKTTGLSFTVTARRGRKSE